jgi:hypothetical protein
VTGQQETIALRVESIEEHELRAREVVREVLPVLRGQALRERTREANAEALRDLDRAITRCEAVLFRKAGGRR